jgi:hypothetical protein
LKRTTRPAFASISCLLALLAASCVSEDEGVPPPLDGLHFPSGMALSPPGGDGRQFLVVASSNFDLRYRAGAVHVLDLGALDALADGAPAPADCPPGPDGLPTRCRSPEVPDLTPAIRGAVEIGNFSGEVALAPVAGGLRAFVPVREGNGVVAVDVPADGVPACAAAGGEVCGTVGFPAEDPFHARVVGSTVYVANIRSFGDEGRLGVAGIEDPLWARGGEMPTVLLGEFAGGGIAASCAPVAEGAAECSAGGTLLVSARSIEDAKSPVYLLDIPPGGSARGPVRTVDVFAEQRGLDSRDVAVSGDGAFLYMVTRFPSGLATLRLADLFAAGADGCVVLPPVPEGFRCPAAGGEPVLVNRSLLPTGAEPNDVTVIPRAMPGGGSSDLVLVTTQDGIDVVDTRADVVAARLDELGSVPSAVVYRPHGTGYRLYVTSFGRGTLAVVDMPDPFRPDLATVVARLGPVQEGSF